MAKRGSSNSGGGGGRLRLLLLVCAALTAAAVGGGEDEDPCTSIVIESEQYNVGYLRRTGPFSVLAAEYTYEIAVCTALVAACPGSTACGAGNTAGVCQEWPGGAACCGQSVPALDVSRFTNASDTGISFHYKNGDACTECSPEPRETVLTVLCDPTVPQEPNHWEIISASPPSPVYRIFVRHASGCPVTDAPSMDPSPVPPPVPTPVPVPMPVPAPVPVPVPAPDPTPIPICEPPTCPANQCAGFIDNPCGSPIDCTAPCMRGYTCVDDFCQRATPPTASAGTPSSSNLNSPPSASTGWSLESILLIIMITLLVVVIVIGCPVLCCILVKLRRVEDSESRPFFHWPIKSPQSRYM